MQPLIATTSLPLAASYSGGGMPTPPLQEGVIPRSPEATVACRSVPSFDASRRGPCPCLCRQPLPAAAHLPLVVSSGGPCPRLPSRKRPRLGFYRQSLPGAARLPLVALPGGTMPTAQFQESAMSTPPISASTSRPASTCVRTPTHVGIHPYTSWRL